MDVYAPPSTKIGDILQDERFGPVVVSGYFNNWPCHTYNRGRHKGLLPILCGSLVRACLEEQEGVVAKHWGVTKHTVNQWKAAIAKTGDSDLVYTKLAILRANPDFRKRFGYSD